jgi:hypothetical protein
VKSILFSAVRSDERFSLPAQSIDRVLGLKGFIAKAPMLLLMAIVYAATFMRRLPRFFAALLVLAIFVNFNSIWFRQYMIWPAALLCLALVDVLPGDMTARIAEPNG